MWVETFWSIDLSLIALQTCMDNRHDIQASFRLIVFFSGSPDCAKSLLHNIQIPNSNRSVERDIRELKQRRMRELQKSN